MLRICRHKVLYLFLSVVVCSCTKSNHQTASSDEMFLDIIQDLRDKGDYVKAINLVDSLEQTSVISDELANSYRGSIYYDLGQTRSAEYYLRKSLANEQLLKENRDRYYDSRVELGTLLTNKGDQEGFLDNALKAYAISKNDTSQHARCSSARLLGQIGNCQLWLGRKEDAAKTFKQAYSDSKNLLEAYHTEKNAHLVTGLLNNIIIEYNNTHNFHEAKPWLDLMAQSVETLATFDDCPADVLDEMQARLAVNRAIIYVETGNKAEAEGYFKEFLSYNYADTDNGLLDKCVYYESSKQWKAAAMLQEQLDSLDQARGVPLSMDYLSSSLGSMFECQLKSGDSKSALATADRIVNLLDSVNTIQQKSDAAELATIYETQEKEQKIAEQEHYLSRMRSVSLLIALVLVSLFFIVYSLYRRRAMRRLKEAYDQLEETTMQKERIESELRIARDIQMSMVPNVFPKTEHLDLYASMTPAREVGGDLYDYLLLDENRLFFCVGDVSGKGVPASLFMAQSIRLFRALAKQQMMPAEIAQRMNAELSEKNEAGMFVTLFIGLIDLSSGHLCFCNCGHNPPVIGGAEHHGEFLQMEANAPIGLWPGLEFVGEEIDTIKHRPLFVYTDGLNEAENLQQEQFGDQRLIHILRETHFDSAQQVIETLKHRVESHRAGAEPNDDLTMLCLMVS